MFSPALKIGLITTAVGVTGTTLYLTSKSTNKQEASLTEKKSIGEFLKEDGLQLLTDKDDNEGPKKGEVFIAAYQQEAPKAEGTIDQGTEKKKHKNQVPEEFKQKCKDSGAQKVKDKNEDIYQKVKSYCTKALGHA